MRIADLILPVFAVILTGWIAGYTGYVSRALSDALIHFAYNIAMPALLIVTIAQEPSHSLINWRFLVAFGGGSLICFILVFGIMSIRGFPKPRKPNDAWHGGINDQYRIRRLTRSAGDLWSARRVAGRDCHGIRGRCDVSS